jgi:hypothetical protein
VSLLKSTKTTRRVIDPELLPESEAFAESEASDP